MTKFWDPGMCDICGYLEKECACRPPFSPPKREMVLVGEPQRSRAEHPTPRTESNVTRILMKDKRDRLLNDLHKIVKEYWYNVHERRGAGTHAAILESHERLEAKLKEIDFFDSLMKDEQK